MDVVDSALWTGRTCEGRIIAYIGRCGFWFLYFRWERDLPEGMMREAYRLMLGRDMCRNLCGLFFHWGYWERGLVWI